MKVKFFKKTLVFLLLTANVLSLSAFAEAVQTGKNSVKITGDVGEAKVSDYTISVYAPNKSYLDMGGDGEANTDVLVYHNELKTNADGSYIVEFNMSGGSGSYQIFVYSDKIGIDASQVLNFRDFDEYADVVSMLNSIAADETKTSDDFKLYATGNRAMLDLYFNDLQSYNEEAALKILYNQTKTEALDTTDISASGKSYRQACIVAEINSGAIADVFEYSEYFEDDVPNLGKYLVEGSTGFTLTQAMKTEITTKLKAASCSTVDDFFDKVAEFVVLEAVKAPNGVTNLKNVMNDFRYATDISGDAYSTSVLNSVIGSNFSSVKEFSDALEKADEKPLGDTFSPQGGWGVSVRYPVESETADVLTVPVDVYVDIDGVVWAKDAIIGLTEKGIVNGKAVDIFAPDDIVLREEFVKMLVMAFAKDEEASEISFDDVSESDWYYEYVAKAVSAGLIKGYSDNVFGAGEPITRQDIAVTLYRAVYQVQNEIDYELEFEDIADISDYAMDAVKVLNKDGIINGMGNNRFCPLERATRAQAAKMIYEITDR